MAHEYGMWSGLEDALLEFWLQNDERMTNTAKVCLRNALYRGGVEPQTLEV